MSDSSADPGTAIAASPTLDRGRPVAAIMLGEREAGWILRDGRGRSYMLANAPGAMPVPLDPARPLASQIPGGATIDPISPTASGRNGEPDDRAGTDPTLDVSAGDAARDTDAACTDARDGGAAAAEPDPLDAHDPAVADPEIGLADEPHDSEAVAAIESGPPPPEPPSEPEPEPEPDEMLARATADEPGREPRVGVTLEVTAGHHVSGTTSPLTHVADKHDVSSAAHAQAEAGTAVGASGAVATSRTLTLAEGAQSTGTIVTVTADRVVQNGGRGTFYVHPRDAFYDGAPEPGTSVTIENRRGRYAVLDQFERAPQDLGRERSGREL